MFRSVKYSLMPNANILYICYMVYASTLVQCHAIYRIGLCTYINVSVMMWTKFNLLQPIVFCETNNKSTATITTENVATNINKKKKLYGRWMCGRMYKCCFSKDIKNIKKTLRPLPNHHDYVAQYSFICYMF